MLDYHFCDFSLDRVAGLSEALPDVVYLVVGQLGLELLAESLVETSVHLHYSYIKLDDGLLIDYERKEIKVFSLYL